MTGRIIDLPGKADDRGRIQFMEAEGVIPFPVRLVYYLWDVPAAVRRGDHAHRHLSEVLIAVSGTVTVRLEGPAGVTVHRMDRPDRGLLIEPMTWLELRDFSHDAVILLLASHPYDEHENIRDRAEYDQWLREARRKGLPSGRKA